MKIKTIDGKQWRTPLTDYAPRQAGTARLRRTIYRGTYHYEGTEGFEFYKVKGTLPVVMLQQKTTGPRGGVKWPQWMVDDPLHWDGMREAVADLPSGRILVAGLGLGLMLHHIAEQPRFTEITVVEINPDVVQLISPSLPHDPRVTIVMDDFDRYIERRPKCDGVLWDLAVGNREQTGHHLMRGMVLCSVHVPQAKLVQFGIRRRQEKDSY